jgi:hypothetical protein
MFVFRGSVFPIALLALAISGCIPVRKHSDFPNHEVRPTGEILGVGDDSIVTMERYKEKVGRVTDSKGRTVADIYETGMREKHEKIWVAYQGSTRIDTEAFFRIAGRHDIAKRIHDRRRKWAGVERAGWISLLGAVGAGGVAALFPEGSAGRGLAKLHVTVGAIAGVTMAWLGGRNSHPDRHDIPLAEAIQAAAIYNRRLTQAPQSQSETPNAPPLSLALGGQF